VSQRRTPTATRLIPAASAGLILLILSFGPSVPAQPPDFWPDPAANHIVPYQTSGLQQGPMLGRPAERSIRVWVRTGRPGEFRVVYDRQLPLSAESPGVVAVTVAERDNTGYVDLVDLEPNTRYYYGVLVDGVSVDRKLD